MLLFLNYLFSYSTLSCRWTTWSIANLKWLRNNVLRNALLYLAFVQISWIFECANWTIPIIFKKLVMISFLFTTLGAPGRGQGRFWMTSHFYYDSNFWKKKILENNWKVYIFSRVEIPKILKAASITRAVDSANNRRP